jgi:hypothetical protein
MVQDKTRQDKRNTQDKTRHDKSTPTTNTPPRHQDSRDFHSTKIKCGHSTIISLVKKIGEREETNYYPTNGDIMKSCVGNVENNLKIENNQNFGFSFYLCGANEPWRTWVEGR